ncbi:MAG TPA: hypothetical protein VNT02_03170 [Burkholderiales bacterium]|nr:hypothetical protein [Burkholderiales bacterium]
MSGKSAVAGCDGCTACCRIMGVHELGKAVNQRCVHCKAGVGCAIYETRPQSCRTFECVWLQTQRGASPLARELRPDASRVVMSTTPDGETVVLNVGTDRPDAWKRGAIGKLVSEMLADGVPVLLKCGDAVRKLNR